MSLSDVYPVVMTLLELDPFIVWLKLGMIVTFGLEASAEMMISFPATPAAVGSVKVIALVVWTPINLSVGSRVAVAVKVRRCMEFGGSAWSKLVKRLPLRS